MKTIFNPLYTFVIAFACFLLSCETKNDTMNNSQNQSQQFATSNEAVAKGKNDLMEILKINKNNSFQIDAELLEKSQMEESIMVSEIDIPQFLKSDSIQSFRDLISNEKGKITPLYTDGKIVTSIHTRIDNGSWSVSGIKDQIIEAEISALRNANPLYNNSDIKLYEIPNINAHVYALLNNGQETYYTNYNGNDLSKPIGVNTLASTLRTDALEFERLYGDQIRKGKLVR